MKAAEQTSESILSSAFVKGSSAFIELTGNSKYVHLGEASHGAREYYYTWRDEGIWNVGEL